MWSLRSEYIFFRCNRVCSNFYGSLHASNWRKALRCKHQLCKIYQCFVRLAVFYTLHIITQLLWTVHWIYRRGWYEIPFPSAVQVGGSPGFPVHCSVSGVTSVQLSPGGISKSLPHCPPLHNPESPTGRSPIPRIPPLSLPNKFPTTTTITPPNI